MNTTTETRTFVGEPAFSVLGSYAGFCLDCTYELQVEQRRDGNIGIKLSSQEQGSSGVEPLVLTRAQFEKWFKK